MNFYHVIYVQEPSGETIDVYVSASTQANAVAAAQNADAAFSSLTSIETIANGVIVGS